MGTSTGAQHALHVPRHAVATHERPPDARRHELDTAAICACAKSATAQDLCILYHQHNQHHLHQHDQNPIV